MSYVTGLSGGGVVAVSLVIVFYENILSKGNTKVDAGFAVTVADIFGKFWGVWLPGNQTHGNWSDLASANTTFTLDRAPMPIITFSEVVPGVSLEIDGIMLPGLNATNRFNLTSYEISPYEFGSWVGGRVQAFMPTKYLGTTVSNGSAANESQCVKGFDKYMFIQGTTADACPGSLIDVLGELNVFSKRQAAPRPDLDLDIPTADTDSSKVRLVRLTAQHYGQTFNESLCGTYPNPLQDYNEAMEGVGDLLLADGSLAGEQNPIRPLIAPGRNVDFIIAFEASGDAQYNWVNGSSLISESFPDRS
ncbi:hypothetical protein N3K66_007507 [Trichothecium roseum]|uniref:Uncharacterized protein n=1 Tax=Trichothecium roseum TaxID=47278 RepID=A0ACC0UU65_9HYPO|nr:hypothetical protein N3K66_007507 [Trichothecium roseum]